MGRVREKKVRVRKKASRAIGTSTGPGVHWRVLGYSLFVLVGVAIAVFGSLLLSPMRNVDSPAAASPVPETPKMECSLAAMLYGEPGQLGAFDIAEANLRCAEGLPGADGVDTTRCLATLDRWAAQVKIQTDKHLYRLADPRVAKHYRNSESFFRASMLLQILQEDRGVKYNLKRSEDINFSDSRDLFIHGIIGDGEGGTCVSMPVLYVAVGRRLGYPLKLVLAKAHVFCRWEGKKGDRLLFCPCRGVFAAVEY